MSKCPNCGYENDENSYKCSNCHILLKEYQKNNNNISETNKIKHDINFNDNQNREKSEQTFSYYEGYYKINHVNDLNSYYQSNKSKKSIILGILLSLFITGTGNIYAGLFLRGTVEFIISILLNSLIPYNPTTIFDMTSIFLYIGLIWELYVIYDTYKCIKALNNDEDIPLFLGLINLKK